jgi:hypothetical protein
MSLTISYEPPEGGRPWYVDVELSESYEVYDFNLHRNTTNPLSGLIGRY